MKALLDHLPLWLAIFLVIGLGLTDLAMSFDAKVLVTLLAPILWIGLYLLGSKRAAREP
ncbi:MAG: hypothetical protein HZB51_18000 [Chloroflexi bacterium]|nr:hypothetical protein [Chloroflexota bacterium]